LFCEATMSNTAHLHDAVKPWIDGACRNMHGVRADIS
jgi:hypothetical protein